MHEQTQTERILRLPEVIDRTGLSRSTIYAYIEKDMFPKPIKLGLRAVGWHESAISQWINSKG